MSDIFNTIITKLITSLTIFYQGHPYFDTQLVSQRDAKAELLHLFNNMRAFIPIMESNNCQYLGENKGYDGVIIMGYTFKLGDLNDSQKIYFYIGRGVMDIYIDESPDHSSGSEKVSCSISHTTKPSGGCINSTDRFNTYMLGIRSYKTKDGVISYIKDSNERIIKGTQLISAMINICKIMGIHTIYLSDASQIPCKTDSKISIEDFIIYRFLIDKDSFYKNDDSHYTNQEVVDIVKAKIKEWKEIPKNAIYNEFINLYNQLPLNSESFNSDKACFILKNIIKNIVDYIGEENMENLRSIYICTNSLERTNKITRDMLYNLYFKYILLKKKLKNNP